MDMMSLLQVVSFVLLGISVAGLVYSFIKKRSKVLWIGLIIVSLILPFIFLIAFGEKRETIKDKYGEAPVVEPLIDKSENINIKEGMYIVGKDIPVGTYDVTIDDKFGEITLLGMEQSKTIMQRLGLQGIEKIRLPLEEGDELSVSDEAILTPVKEELFAYEELKLYAGIWYVGKDITPGRYTILPTTDTVGEVKIYEQANLTRVANGLLGKGQNPEAINIDLIEGYRLEVSDMNFNLVPTTE